jgi:3-oxoacyl-[acyl-carrier protein] reductase
MILRSFQPEINQRQSRYNLLDHELEKETDCMNLQGKYAVITGGTRGIGRATADLLAQQGADVMIAARSLEQAQAAALEVAQATGRQAVPFTVDVSSPVSAKAMIDTAIAAFGRIDILVNNAGVTRDTLIMRMEEDDWDYVLDINLKGTFNCSKAVVRQMLKQRYGRIINVSSVAGLMGNAGQTNYSASKAGIIGFSKALARELASRQITVNVVAPGFVPTALTNDLPEELKTESLKMIPLGRWGKPEEVASAIAFLASDQAAYITGQVLGIDGGMAMM